MTRKFTVVGREYTDPYEAAVAVLEPAVAHLRLYPPEDTRLVYILASTPEIRAILSKALDEVDMIMDQAKPAGVSDVPF